jgi:predicted acyltransferase
MNQNQRFLALDVFRGMTICFMIIVNTSGNGATTYAPLMHANWNGFTPTDLVFPSFLFAVGNAMSFVMKRWYTMPQKDVLFKIFKRTSLIFLLGFLMYWFPFFKLDSSRNIIAFPFSDTRIFGVLQRIALCYGIVALLLYYLKPKITLIITGLILFIYWLFYWNFGEATMASNPVLNFDLAFFGENHLYKGEGIPFDPEGLLSTLPALFNVTAGYWAGKFIQEKGKTYEGLFKLVLIGFVLISVAFMWNYGFPINKKLWTSSFAVLTVGLDFCIIATVIYYIDFMKITKGTYFFEVFGKNPLVIYLISELLVVVLYMIQVGKISLFAWFYRTVFQNFGDYFGAFLFAIAYMMICWIIGYIMDKKKIYVRL